MLHPRPERRLASAKQTIEGIEASRVVFFARSALRCTLDSPLTAAIAHRCIERIRLILFGAQIESCHPRDEASSLMNSPGSSCSAPRTSRVTHVTRRHHS